MKQSIYFVNKISYKLLNQEREKKFKINLTFYKGINDICLKITVVKM